MRLTAEYCRNMTAGLAAICLLACCGCASMKAPSLPKMPEMPAVPSVSNVFDKQEPKVEPDSLAVVWTTAVMEKEASRSTRGFGGMVTFYGKDQKKPVRVNGRLTVYAYSDMSHEHDDPTPDRKYIFTPEQLETHYGEGPVGPSYSIWIPWDDAGGEREEIGLIVRFDSTEGKTVMGKPTHNVLKGPAVARKPKPTKSTPAAQANYARGNNAQGNNAQGNNVEQVCYLPPVDGQIRDGQTRDRQARSEKPKDAGRRMQTMTVTVPRR